jgi:hypothetical protein
VGDDLPPVDDEEPHEVDEEPPEGDDQLRVAYKSLQIVSLDLTNTHVSPL